MSINRIFPETDSVEADADSTVRLPQFREIDMSLFPLHAFAQDWHFSEKSYRERVDARFSQLEQLLHSYGISPVDFERLDDVTLVVTVRVAQTNAAIEAAIGELITLSKAA